MATQSFKRKQKVNNMRNNLKLWYEVREKHVIKFKHESLTRISHVFTISNNLLHVHLKYKERYGQI